MLPRRGRCRGCGRTQVLLPARVLLRRADTVTVIGAALLAKASGVGHRPIAVLLRVPSSTVRGWLRRIAMVAERVLAVLAAAAAQLGVEFAVPAPTADPVAAVVEMLGALSAGVVPPESWRVSLCGFPVGGRDVLVVNRTHHAGRAVPTVVVVEPVAPVQHDRLGLAGVLEVVS